MKHLCCKNKFLIVIAMLFLSISAVSASFWSKSAVVYYGDKHPYELLGSFDVIITEPENVNTYTHGFKKYKEKIFAYVSIGEIEKNRSYYTEVQNSWVIGENKTWKSKVLNLSNAEYQAFLINRVIASLIKNGYKNFFFDTVDSYHLLSLNEKARVSYEDAIVLFLKKLKMQYPGIKVILNRGFEIIDKAHPYINGVLFESLFYGFDKKTLQYKEVSKEDREWLLEKTRKIQAYGLPVIALDYLPPNQWQKAKNIVEKIKNSGLIPYIGDKELRTIGISSVTPVKRKVLILYNTYAEDKYGSAAFNAASALEYLGYIPYFIDISKEGIPKDAVSDRYAGVIIWFEKTLKNENRFKVWVEKVVNSNTKILFLGTFGFTMTQKALKPLGLEVQRDTGESEMVFKNEMVGYELMPQILYDDTFLIAHRAKSLLSVKKSSNHRYDIAAITQWGGFFNSAPIITTSDGKDRLWTVDPFQLFKEALRLESFPIPDTTTENGNRLLFVQVDSDILNTKTEFKPDEYNAQTLIREVIKRYKIPHTFSVTEKEVSKKGRGIAAEMYKIPYVKPVNYAFATGDTTIQNSTPWLTRITPTGIRKGEYYQIYMPMMNENIYTNWWQDSFWGFKKVIQTFKLTDKPKRLKPINIYYHNYSASKKASLNALHTVYNWALNQDIMPVFAGDYVKKALDFYDIAIARTDQGFVINGARDLKTLRLEKNPGFPDLKTSRGIVGYRDLEQGRYMHLSSDKTHSVTRCASGTKQSRLISANAAAVSFDKREEQTKLTLQGYVPIEFEYYVPNNCSIKTYPPAKKEHKGDNVVRFHYTKAKKVTIAVNCR